jgi:hypothetical protein
MLSSQQHADLCLVRWQEMRGRPDEERIEVLMSRFFDPPPLGDVEYQATLNAVSEAMV